MDYNPLIKTKRLILRPWKKEDAGVCYKIASDPRIGPNCGWQPHQNIDETKDIIESILMIPGNYAIQLKAGILIGNIGFKEGTVMENKQQREIGCWLDVAYWHQGYMTEALQVLLDQAFNHLQLCALWYDCYSDNERSKQVAFRNGFVLDHVLKHHYVAGLHAYKDLLCMKLTQKQYNNRKK